MHRGWQTLGAVAITIAVSACTTDEQKASDSAAFATGAAGTVPGGGMDSAGRPANDSMALSSGLRDSAGIRDSAAKRDSAAARDVNRIRGETQRSRTAAPSDTARKRPPR